MSERFRVLVIDDDPGVREYMEALVTRQGYQVFAAADGEEALSALQDSRPDLITLDVVLPGMDGLATLAELKKRLPDVPVVMLSGGLPAQALRGRGARAGLPEGAREARPQAGGRALRGRARSETELLLLCGDNPKMKEVRDIIEQVADTDITVLIRGESGTGKELVARTLYQLSGRREPPLRQGELRRAALGAARERALRLREGGLHRSPEAQARQVRVREPRHDLPRRDQRDAPGLQAKLLQVLQDGEFSRLGGEATSGWTRGSSPPPTATSKRR